MTILDLFYASVTVYPCAYREHRVDRVDSIIAMTATGLSLCIQGTCLNYWDILFVIRFIPVHTGNISNANKAFLPFSVYPCVYREHKP